MIPDRNYWDTRLNLLKGERWFCSKQAARTAAMSSSFSA